MVNYTLPLDNVFQALADPHRRQIVERLARGEASVKEIAAPLPMSLPAVMAHLRVLETSGLVTSRKTGRVRTCTLDRNSLSAASVWIEARHAEWTRRFDRLAAYLEKEGNE